MTESDSKNKEDFRDPIITSDRLREAGCPLTADYLKGIYSLASRLSRMYGKYNLLEDFQQTAIMTAALKEPKFDTERGASFYTYVAPSIQASLFHQFGTAKKHSAVYKKIEEFTRAFEDSNNYYPDILQIAESLELPVWQIKSIYVNDTPTEVPLDDNVSPDDVIGDSKLDLEELLQDFNQSEQMVVRRYFLNGESLGDIATSSGLSVWVLEEALRQTTKKLKETLVTYL